MPLSPPSVRSIAPAGTPTDIAPPGSSGHGVAGTDTVRQVHCTVANVAGTPDLRHLSIAQLLAVRHHGHCTPGDVLMTLRLADSNACRELHAIRLQADPHGAMSTACALERLLSHCPADRTIDQLADAGIFIVSERRQHLGPEDAELLLSDEGLLLWLTYASGATALLSLFVSMPTTETMSCTQEQRMAKALRVLIACGRDTTIGIRAGACESGPMQPLSHVCCIVAHEWLPFLLDMGADPNQRDSNGMPLVFVAMASASNRLRMQGIDIRKPSEALLTLAALLQSHGADLGLRTPRDAHPVCILASQGHIGAATALLEVGLDPNLPDANGNTVLHELALCVRHPPQNALTANLMLKIAVEHGGDVHQRNHAGHSPLVLLPSRVRSHIAWLADLYTHVRAAPAGANSPLAHSAPARHSAADQ